MIRSLVILVCALSVEVTASAHRLDEYLEATMISLDNNRVHADIRLTPGVAVLPVVLAEIDTDADGVISDLEQKAYAGQVLKDLSFDIDGSRVQPHLVSLRFPAINEMKEGLGEIHIEAEAPLPPGGPHRKLTFENHHEFPIAAYLVNCLVPRDPNIRIVAQSRNYSQSSYQLDFIGPRPLLSAVSVPAGTALFLLLAGLGLWRSAHSHSGGLRLRRVLDSGRLD